MAPACIELAIGDARRHGIDRDVVAAGQLVDRDLQVHLALALEQQLVGLGAGLEGERGILLGDLVQCDRELDLVVAVLRGQRLNEDRRIGPREVGDGNDAIAGDRLAGGQGVDLGHRHDLARLGNGHLVEALAERPEQRADTLTAKTLAFAQGTRPNAAERELAGVGLMQDLEAFGHGDAIGGQ